MSGRSYLRLKLDSVLDRLEEGYHIVGIHYSQIDDSGDLDITVRTKPKPTIRIEDTERSDYKEAEDFVILSRVQGYLEARIDEPNAKKMSKELGDILARLLQRKA